MFFGMDDVLWLILVLWHVLSKNQPGATLAPLGNFVYGPKTKWPPGDYVPDYKYSITSLLLVLES